MVGMEQTEINPRPVVGAIIVGAALPCHSFCGLLYVIMLPADFAGAGRFWPALNALLNGLCAIALCVGLYFIKHQNKEAHRTSMLLASRSLRFFIRLHREPRSAWRHDFPGHGPVGTLYLSILAKPR